MENAAFLPGMDPLTHSVLGVAVAIAGSPRSVPRRAAALAGLFAGLLPDADILLRSASDPLFAIEYHRHFTHSFAFLPVIAIFSAVAASLVLKAFKKTVPWPLLILPALLAGVSHILCDVWTSYGTRAWWPFASTRVSLDLISVIDPVFTIPLVACVALAVRYASRRAALTGLAWVMVYLGFCVVQRHRASSALDGWLAANPLPDVSRRELKPSFGNVIVWRGLVQWQGQVQVLAIRCPLAGEPAVIKGMQHPIFADANAAAEALNIPPGSTQENDIRRFFHFSDNWVGRHPVENLVLGDLRYANLPTEISPLWGIGLDPQDPSRHVSWLTFRGDPTPSLQRLMRLVQGKPDVPPAAAVLP